VTEHQDLSFAPARIISSDPEQSAKDEVAEGEEHRRMILSPRPLGGTKASDPFTLLQCRRRQGLGRFPYCARRSARITGQGIDFFVWSGIYLPQRAEPGGAPMGGYNREAVVENLREYLRRPENAVTDASTNVEQQRALENLWAQALGLTDGDIGRALEASIYATRSEKGSNETEAEFQDRKNGIPERAFGVGDEFGGIDKPQHFFASALVAYTVNLAQLRGDLDLGDELLGGAIAQVLGEAYEIADEIGKEIDVHPTGYSQGDIEADNVGTEFGHALSLEEFDFNRFGGVDIREFLPDPEDLPGVDYGDDMDDPDEDYGASGPSPRRPDEAADERGGYPDKDDDETQSSQSDQTESTPAPDEPDADELVDYPDVYYDETQTSREEDEPVDYPDEYYQTQTSSDDEYESDRETQESGVFDE
jgi:hypothetical protein